MRNTRLLPARQIAASRPWSRPALGAWDWLVTPLAAFLVHAVLTFIVGSFAVTHLTQRRPMSVLGFRPVFTGELSRHLIQPLTHWDSIWYLLIAQHGYRPGQEATAFWPLYPLLIRFGSTLTGWSPAVVGVLLSNLALAAALVFFYRLVALEFEPTVASRAVWLLALFPTAFFFSAVYTESLFLLLTVAAVYCGRIDRWGLAGVLGFLSALTRNTGVLVLIPLGLLLVRKYGWNPRRWWTRAVWLIPIALAPALFLGYIGSIWGDPLLPARIQQAPLWDREQVLPWQTLMMAFHRVDLSRLNPLLTQLDSGDFGRLLTLQTRRALMESQVYEFVVILGALLLLLYTVRRLPLRYSLYAVVALLVPLTSPSHYNPLLGMMRFLIVIFPLFIAAALLLRRRWLFVGVMLLFTLQYVGLLLLFSTGIFVA